MPVFVQSARGKFFVYMLRFGCNIWLSRNATVKQWLPKFCWDPREKYLEFLKKQPRRFKFFGHYVLRSFLVNYLVSLSCQCKALRVMIEDFWLVHIKSGEQDSRTRYDRLWGHVVHTVVPSLIDPEFMLY